MRRGATGRRVRAFDVPAGALTVVLRLPKRSHGHVLRPGRYQITVVAIDGAGHRSAPVVKTLIVRR
jgi:hypothetical protein